MRVQKLFGMLKDVWGNDFLHIYKEGMVQHLLGSYPLLGVQLQHSLEEVLEGGRSQWHNQANTLSLLVLEHNVFPFEFVIAFRPVVW